jgi:sugar lactone lactonase YvrE
MKSLIRMILLCLFCTQLSHNCLAQTGIITTIAGTGDLGFSGDGGPATAAQIRPSKMAMDSVGNLYFTEQENHRIRKVNTAGVITTVVGTGSVGFSGDGGLATNAQLNYPNGIAVDAVGNLYIADTQNNRVRKVTAAGVITTFVGTGTYGFSGDGSLAISAQLARPCGVATDSAGNLYIADTENLRIRKVFPSGVITTIAGNGEWEGISGDGRQATSVELYYPKDITVDSGNLYIVDYANARIRKVNLGGVITTVAGNGSLGFSGDGGPATAAQLYNPMSVAMDSSGYLYISDSENDRIRKVSPAGVITTIAGNGTNGFSGDGGLATSAALSNPDAVVLDSLGNFYIADFFNYRIRKVTGTSFSSTYYPHVAIGGGWSTLFTLINTNANTVTGNLFFYDTQGNPLTVRISSSSVGSSFPISIPVGGTMFLTVNPLNSNDPAKSGWAKASTSGGSLDGVATFQQFSDKGAIQTAAGVLSTQPIQFVSIPVNDNADQNLATAYGIANPTDQILTIKVALVDLNGAVVDDTKSFTLNPGQQIARFFNQDFSQKVFQGSMVLRAQGTGTFVAVALIQNQQLFTAIPVIRSKAPNIPN